MIVTSIIAIDLRDKYNNAILDAVQYDKNSRVVEATILEGGIPFRIPATDVTYEVRFKRGDGSPGNYSELSDGTKAVRLKGQSVLSIYINDLILSVPGIASISVCMKENGQEINTFSFYINVQKNVLPYGTEIKYPNTYDATASSDNIEKGKAAYVNGEKVTGSLRKTGMFFSDDTTVTYSNGTIDTEAVIEDKQIFDSNASITLSTSASEFGNATAADVAKGKTFTSAAGLLVKGEHECEGGVELPALGDTAAQPTDIVSGKVLYDDDGNPVTGELAEILEGRTIAAREFKDLSKNGDNIETRAVMNVADVVVRKNAMFRTYAPASAFGNATADQVAKGATFTSASGLLVEGTMEAASGGGLAVKKGSTSSTTIDTGLSSIDYVVLLADSFSGTGLLQFLYRKPNNAISYILCTSYSYNSQKNELSHASMTSSTLLTIDGGKVTWNGTGTSAFMSGASYMWIAFGTE